MKKLPRVDLIWRFPFFADVQYYQSNDRTEFASGEDLSIEAYPVIFY